MRASRPLAAAAASWNDPRFRRHLAGAEGADWPVAVLGEAAARAIGAESRIVRLSSETAAKQRRRHPDIRLEDYFRIQDALDREEVFHQYDRTVLVLIEEGNRVWRAAIKATASGEAVFLATLHRAKRREPAIIRRRYRRIGSG